MKQKLLKTLALGLLLTGGGNGAWAQTNLLSATNLSVSAKQGGVELEASNKVLSGGALTLNSLAASELTLTLTFDAISVDASKCFVILETSQGIFNTGGTFKARNITLDGNKFDSGNSADKSTTTYTKDAVTHDVILMSPMGKNTATISGTSTQMLAYYAENIDGSMSLTSIGFNIPVSTTGNVTIYRIGLYDIAEIESLYENPAMRFKSSNSHSLYLEFGGTANQVLVNNNTITLTAAEAGVLLKSVGNIPSTYEVDFRKLAISEGSPFTQETMGNLSSAKKVNINAAVYKYFPTVNDNLYLVPESGYKHRFRIFKDGGHPNGGGVTRDAGSGSTTEWYGTYNRNLVAGYSSVMLPYEVSYADLTAAGLTAYTFASFTSGTVTFSKLASGTISAHTPFIVKAENSGLYLIPSNGVISDFSTLETWYKNYNYASVGSEDCYFIGSFINEVPGTTTGKGWPTGVSSSAYDFYGINSDGTKFLKMAADTKTTYYRAFIADKRTAGAPELTLSFNDGNGTTDIVQLKDVHGLTQEDGAVYNLQGVRMTGSNLPAGIYVKNGKKYVVK